MQFRKARLSFVLAQLGFFAIPGSLMALPLPQNPKSPGAQQLFKKGSEQFLNHQFTAARESFQQASQLSPADAEVYRALGMADIELKDYEGSYRAWTKAAELDAKDEKSRYFLGRLFYEADLPNEGAAWLREAIRLAPDDFEARTYLGLCAEALGYDDTALRLYRKAVAESDVQGRPYAKAYLSLAEFLNKHGSQDQALSVLEQGANKCPESHELTTLGELLARSNQAEQAEQVLRQAIALDPNLSQAHYRLALLLKSTGRSQESQREMALFQQTKAAEDRQPKVTAFRKQTAQ